MIRIKFYGYGALLAMLWIAGCSQPAPAASQLSPATGTKSKTPTAQPSSTLAAPLTATSEIAAPTHAPIATPAPAPVEEQVIRIASMSVSRAAHTATLLPDGSVLITGGCVRESCEAGELSASAELYDPVTGVFKPATSMTIARVGSSATLLQDGRVLIAGGWSGRQPTASAELYDPASGSFTPTGAMTTRRGGHTETLLADGRVLLTGGFDGSRSLASAELYDPSSGAFSATGSMTVARNAHGASSLLEGEVLVTGGSSEQEEVLASAELYDIATGRFMQTREMTAARHKHASVALQDGQVLIIGGSDARDGRGQYTSTELYEPASGVFRSGARMRAARFKLPAAVALLPNGEVLVAGSDASAEIYSPETDSFRVVRGSLEADRAFSTATLLQNGEVLIAGGYDPRIMLTADAWVYRP